MDRQTYTYNEIELGVGEELEFDPDVEQVVDTVRHGRRRTLCILSPVTTRPICGYIKDDDTPCETFVSEEGDRCHWHEGED